MAPALLTPTTPGATVRDPRTNAIGTVASYDRSTDEVTLTDGRVLPWAEWDRMEVVR